MPLSLRPLGAEHLTSSFELASRVFATGSTLHLALGIELETYRAYLWPSFQAMLAEGLSVGAFDPDTGALLGCLIVTAFEAALPDAEQTDPRFAALSALTAELVARYQRARPLENGAAVLVDMGAVTPEARRRGVYAALRSAVTQHCAQRGYRTILGELSSRATQHVVLGQLGHRAVAQVPFATFQHNGTRPFAAITDPKALIMSEGDLRGPAAQNSP
jgi:GNAT superfamily N-acetyltransferase